jgi:ribosomal protein S18 acetylase RimI-like enzyme
MSDLYKQSSWGLDLKSKSKELKHCRAHFLVVTEDVDLSREEFNKHTIVPNAADKDQEQKNGGDNKQDKNPILAFLHYRYELDESYDPQMPQLVLYVYELQISHILQRCGVGQRLMNVVTRIALQHNETHKKRRNNGGSASVSIKGIMLTVFTHNRSAVAFYKKKLQFEVAPCSPSFMENEQTYKRITRSRGSADEKRDHSADYEILYKAIR